MSYVLDRLFYFTREQKPFADGHGITTDENRHWEQGYRQRWQYDKIVYSTHGVNCTGSCSWKIYVKNGLITWETQRTDYPRTRPDLPNHEPRGCQRGASFSWYIYSAARVKYPLVRGKLVRLWREARSQHKDPVVAWESIVTNPKKSLALKQSRGMGGFIRANWDEANEIIAASNVYTAKKYGPDRIAGFSPIPAMSMVSYAAGTRYLSLIGGVCLSFYDWYCDLPPSSPQTWGEQTDVPESADWYNSSFIIAWGSNVPQTRTPDAHFFSEVRYSGTKTVVVTPDYSEVAKFGDIWLHPKQGTDAALSMAMGHVILKEFHVNRQSKYFTDYCRRFSDMPFLVRLQKTEHGFVPERMIRAADFADHLGINNNPEWKTLVFDAKKNEISVPNGTSGMRWGQKGKWNLELRDERDGREIEPILSLLNHRDDIASVAFPYFGNAEHPYFNHTEHGSILHRHVPVKKVTLSDGEYYIATVFDLLVANYGVDQGLGGDSIAASYDDDVPYTPAWQEKITGVKRDDVITVAREFAKNAEQTEGRSMIILGAGLNHWYNQDMNYRGIINMLIMCGCVGQSGGGWAHYVGQEKLRPQCGWLPLAFALDWVRPPRQMNGTSFFYRHSGQWRHEQIQLSEILSPLETNNEWKELSLIDCNVKAERMGWLPSAPQLDCNSLSIAKKAEKAGQDPAQYLIQALKNKNIQFAHSDPDNLNNAPKVLFVWRSNLLGASGKGHEYFLKYLLGTESGIQGKDLGELKGQKPKETIWRDKADEGKLDLFVTLDFRMSTNALYSDIVLPTATWYEKDDLNTTDMHPFIHTLSAALDPAWESRSDWDIYKGITQKFSELSPGHLGVEKDVVLTPIMHDTKDELGQALEVKDWTKGECDPIPGKTMPNIAVVERDYPNVYKKFTSLGPLLEKLGNGGKGIVWNTQDEVEFLKRLNLTVEEEGVSKNLAKIESAIDAAEVILTLAPETNGHVAMKAWDALSQATGREHAHLAAGHEDEKIRFRDIQAQPKKIISSPTWSGIESDKVSYNAGYTNVHELIPWRTLTGRQQFYQDHAWMRAFGEGFCLYRPPVNLKTVAPVIEKFGQGYKQVVLNFISPHQKWGIHSTYNDNLIMLTLNRGGPVIWISEIDAAKADIVDNDWIEAYNMNGAIVARAVVSQRVPEGMTMMYHAQEKNINTPASEVTGKRGGLHNSVTRASVKPTHMIGGYVQLAYGFNYYGTVGSNRDDFVIVRKMERVEWMNSFNDKAGE